MKKLDHEKLNRVLDGCCFVIDCLLIFCFNLVQLVGMGMYAICIVCYPSHMSLWGILFLIFNVVVICFMRFFVVRYLPSKTMKNKGGNIE